MGAIRTEGGLRAAGNPRGEESTSQKKKRKPYPKCWVSGQRKKGEKKRGTTMRRELEERIGVPLKGVWGRKGPL